MRRLATLLLALAPSVALAGTVHVGSGQAYATLGPAVTAAGAGDTVLVEAGTYTIPSSIPVAKALTIRGNGTVVLQGSGIDLLQVTSGAVTIEGLVLHPTGGRGLAVSGGTVTVRGVEISGNTGIGNADGAAILVTGGTVTIASSALHDDTARSGSVTTMHGGCLAITAGNVTVRDTRFERCKSQHGGAIDVAGGTLIVERGTFVDNEAGEPYDGGAIRVAIDGDATITDSTFTGNTAFERGGAIHADGDLTVQRSRFEGNLAGRATSLLYVTDAGGAVSMYCDLAPCPRAVVEDSWFSGNQALATGGAVYVATPGPSRLVRNVFCGNSSSADAGAVYVTSRATAFTILANVFVENVAVGSGGGLWCNVGGAGGTVVGNDFLGNASASGDALNADGCGLAFKDNAVVGHDGTAVVAGTGPFDYNAWFDDADEVSGRSLGAHDVFGDPKLGGWSADGNCANDDFTPGAGSSLVDHGDPAILDRDGSRSDIGVTGGPESVLLVDDDNDGFPAGRDCDDGNPAVAPGRPELCNGVDEDCDGAIDLPAPASAPLFYQDADGDGHGVAAITMHACAQPTGWSTLADDCDDGNATLHPGAVELCNGIDDDCDALTDGADADDLPAWYPDLDGDGHGRGIANPERGCTGAPGTVALGDDCDDGNAAIAPGMPEHCDGVDEDCDGKTDDHPVAALLFYADADADGWGDAAGETRESCRVPEHFAIASGDCDDADPDVHPNAPEPCSPPRDLNCDGASGSDDHDSDGFPACQDCDDFDSSSRPGAEDPWYDGRIQDCDRQSDFDQDGDHFDALTAGGPDCDDLAAAVNPAAADVPGDGLDANCDGIDASAAPGDTDLDGDDTDGGDKVACGGCAVGGPRSVLPLLTMACLLAGRRRRSA